MHIFTDDEFLEAIKSSRSDIEASKKLGYKSALTKGSLFYQFKERLRPDTSHFKLQSMSAKNRKSDFEVDYKSHCLYNVYKKRASMRKIPFLLTLDEFEKLVDKDCFYCGRMLTIKFNNIEVKINGLDRVDNSLGYINSNVVPCCKICNYMKRAMDQNDFINHCTLIANKE